MVCDFWDKRGDGHAQVKLPDDYIRGWHCTEASQETVPESQPKSFPDSHSNCVRYNKGLLYHYI